MSLRLWTSHSHGANFTPGEAEYIVFEDDVKTAKEAGKMGVWDFPHWNYRCILFFFSSSKGRTTHTHTIYIYNMHIYIYIYMQYIYKTMDFRTFSFPIWNCLKSPVLPRTSPFPSKDVDRSFLFPCSRREQEVEAQILWYSLVSHTVEPSHVPSHASCRAVIAVENITKVAAHEFYLAQRRGSTSPDPEPSRGTPDAFPWWSAGFH